MPDCFLGIDLGAETLKIAELTQAGNDLQWTRRALVEHHKEPGPQLLALLEGFGWESVHGAAASGRFGRLVRLPRIPVKQAQAAGCRFLHGDEPATVVSIGSHGFSVLELRASGAEVFRENSRCSQGTGNFLRQLVERFGLTVEEASEICADASEAGSPAGSVRARTGGPAKTRSTARARPGSRGASSGSVRRCTDRYRGPRAAHRNETGPRAGWRSSCT